MGSLIRQGPNANRRNLQDAKSTSNSNWTQWSTIQGVIAQVISKLDEREA